MVWRFWQKVAITGPNECWDWLGAVVADGYGQIRDQDGRVRGAHRLAWEMAYGSVPDGKQLDHLCRNRKCVNIRHLEVVTNRENVVRGFQSRQGDRCKFGHPYDGGTKRQRVCLTCQRRRWHEWKARQA